MKRILRLAKIFFDNREQIFFTETSDGMNGKRRRLVDNEKQRILKNNFVTRVDENIFFFTFVLNNQFIAGAAAGADNTAAAEAPEARESAVHNFAAGHSKAAARNRNKAAVHNNKAAAFE